MVSFTSAVIILLLGPVPEIESRANPCSFAILLAAGLANYFEPAGDEVDWADEAGVEALGVGAAAAAGSAGEDDGVESVSFV